MALMNSHKRWQFESSDNPYDTSEQTKKGRILPENIKQERLNRNIVRKLIKADPMANRSLPAATADSDFVGDVMKGGQVGGMVGAAVPAVLGLAIPAPEEIVTVPVGAAVGTLGGMAAGGTKNILERFLNKKKKTVPAAAEI